MRRGLTKENATPEDIGALVSRVIQAVQKETGRRHQDDASTRKMCADAIARVVDVMLGYEEERFRAQDLLQRARREEFVETIAGMCAGDLALVPAA